MDIDKISKFAWGKRREAIRFSPPSNPSSKLMTHLGGRPTLPAELWPLSNLNRRPMSFVGQVCIDELPSFAERSSLPRDGILFFFSTSIVFFDRSFDGAVIHLPKCKLGAPECPPPPEANKFIEHPTLAQNLWLDEAPKWPMQCHACFTFPQHVPRTTFLNQERWQQVSQFVSLVDRRFNNSLPDSPTLRFNGFQMLGHPCVPQYQQEELVKDHIMLLELHRIVSVPEPFRRIGLAQYWIKPRDLLASCFGRVKQTLDTSD